jgi:hypothetical protein
MEVAINRLTKLRFPQGSKVSISGCPKFEGTVKAGLTNLVTAVKTKPPELVGWRSVFGCPPS